jgi:signal transduction histidine kinase
MWQERIQRYILPGGIEHDAGFRKEIHRLSHIGLRVLGGVEIAVSGFMAGIHFLLESNHAMLPIRATTLLAMVLLGSLTLLSARSKNLYSHSRAIACVSALLVVALLTWSMLLQTQYEPTADDSIPVEITLVMLVCAAAIPLRPTDMLVFGFLVETIYIVQALVTHNVYDIGPGVEPIYVLFIFMLTCLAAVLTAVVYGQRRSNYEWHRRTLDTVEKLRQAEARNLLSENAASVGRLAAAVSHELNSPIGALISGVDTLLLLATRQLHSAPAEQERLVVLQNELRKSIKQSTDRLEEIVARMQRFSNLDMAEVQAANINDLINDVAALLEPKYKDKVQVVMNLRPVPPLVCRPQQLSAVFSSLMGNAIEATNGNGLVTVSSGHKGTNLQVEFSDNGRGLSSQELENIFDPGFRVAQGRVASGNWSMFSARQIVQEHGGEIQIESERGKGTCVRIVLPVGSAKDGLKASV